MKPNKGIIILSCLACALAIPSRTRATNESWNVAGPASWGTGTNWNPAATPAPTDEAFIDNNGTATVGNGVNAHALFVFAGETSGKTGTVNVQGTGTLTATDDVIVGDNGTGTLNVSGANNATVSGDVGSIGNMAGGLGTATVANTGKWTNTFLLYIGNFGNGTLDVKNGGTVSAGAVTIARGNASTTSGLTVEGTGSTFTVTSGPFTIANAGIGTLDIKTGGAVTSKDGDIGAQTGSSGTVTVNGNSGGASWGITGNLTVGDAGGGTVNIKNGGTISNVDGTIGNQSGSTGKVTVDGTGGASMWTNSGDLTVGNSGSGTLNIQAGGVVSDMVGNIATVSGSTGKVSVDGTGSKWTNSDNLFVGGDGTGTLSVTNGGAVSNLNGVLGTAGSGKVTVDGTGSTWTNSGYVYVGNTGTGTLNITTGGAVSDTDGFVGKAAGGMGAVTVDGTGGASMWTNSGNLTVGDFGDGTLDIANAGAVSNVNGFIGNQVVCSGTVTVENAGSTWTNSGSLDVGNFGDGTLNIKSGGAVSDTVGTIADQVGSTGMVTIAGKNSTWTNSSSLTVGNSGNGTLDITGGTVSDTFATIADQTGSTGLATVDGKNSTWTNSSSLTVGNSGNGTLMVINGGSVTNTDGTIADQTGSTGSATVDGTGGASTWTMTGSLTVGNSGNGTLMITGGGVVTNTDGTVGSATGSTGAVTVDGAGGASSWMMTGDLAVGGTQGGPGGQGTLTIQNGGAVNVSGNMWVWGGGTGSGGTLAVDSSYSLTVGATLDFDGGSLHFLGNGVNFTNNVLFGNTQDPSGMIADVDSGNTGTLSGLLTGAGALTKTDQGELDVTNNGNNYSGGTFLKMGSLFADANNALGTGTVTISDATTFGSHVDGTTLANNISVKGDFSVTPASSGFRQLFLEGDVDLNGAVRSITNTVDFGSTEFDGVIKNGGVTLNSSMPFGLFVYGGSSANTYTGLTTVNDQTSLALDKTVTNGAIAGDLLINQGAQVFLARSEQIADDSVVTDNSSGVAIPGFSLQGFDEKIGALFGDANGTVGLNNNGLTAAGTLSVGAGDFAGVISDQGVGGQLIKYGPGTLILSGDNTYVGDTIINGGILQVDGSIASMLTTVNSGGTLAGIGIIGGNVVNGGTVSPGDSPGTLTINGNYTQQSAGNLVIEIASLTNHDLLAVGGAANLDGTLNIVKLANFSVMAGDKIIFLTAAGGVNGEFATVMSDFGATGTLVTPEVVYEPNDVALLFAQGSFLIGGLTPNQQAVAANLNHSVGDARAAGLISFLDTELIANLPHDYDLIAPEELAALYEISFAKAIVQNQNLQHRMDDIRAGSSGFASGGLNMNAMGAPVQDPGLSYGFTDGKVVLPVAYTDGKVVLPTDNKDKNVMTPTPENHWGVWVSGYGDFVNVDGNDNAHGYDISTGSVLVGLDYKVCDHFAIGLDGSYSGGQANLVDDGRIDYDGGQAGAYATIYGIKGFFGNIIHVDLAVNGGWNDYDTVRNGLQNMAVRGSTDGSEFNAMIAYGGDWYFGHFLVGTWSTLQYTDVHVNSFTETGSLAPLSFPDQSEDSLRTSTGLRLAYDATLGRTIFRPEIRAAWGHEYGDRAYPIDARFASGAGGIFTVHGPDIGRDSALVDAGFSLLWNDRVSTYIFYDGNLGRSHYDNNAVSGGLRIAF